MTEQEVEDIALESIEIRERRISLKSTKKAIEESLEACANIAMRKELRAFTGEGVNEFEDSEDERPHVAAAQSERGAQRKPVADAAVSTPIKPQNRRTSQQQTPAHNPIESARHPNSNPGSNNRGSRVQSEFEEGLVAEQYRLPRDFNQYALPSAPQYTPPMPPPPPPPRPAKVPTQGGLHDGPPSPVDSMSSMSNTRYAYSAQDLNAGRPGYDEGSVKKSSRKISNLLRGQA